MIKEAPCSASFFDNSALFAEVIQAQRSGRLLFLVVAHTRNDEYDDRDHIGQDLIELRGNDLTIISVIEDVYFDQLVNVIDHAVERTSDYEKRVKDLYNVR